MAMTDAAAGYISGGKGNLLLLEPAPGTAPAPFSLLSPGG